MLRILHVTPYYEQAWAYGGIPRVASTLTAGLAARGHSVTVATTDASLPDRRLRCPDVLAPGTPAQDTAQSDLRVHVFPNVSNRLAYHLQLFLPRGMAGYLDTHAREFDLAHIHACRNVPGLIAARCMRRAGVPYLVSPHGTALRIERRQTAKWLFDVSVGRGFLNRARRVLAVSEAERRQLLSIDVPDERIRVIPNPIELGEFAMPITRGEFRARLGLSDAPIVLFLGKLTPRKRLDVLARAFAILRHVDARLVVAGNDMGYGRHLARLIDHLGIGDRTMLPGLLTGRERLTALTDADVVVYPSKDEIFGLVPVESLMCGTPVIVADDSGCAEVIQRLGGGLVTREGDPGALASAIGCILDDLTHWQHLARLARSNVPDFCGASVVLEQIEAVYRQVLDRG